MKKYYGPLGMSRDLIKEIRLLPAHDLLLQTNRPSLHKLQKKKIQQIKPEPIILFTSDETKVTTKSSNFEIIKSDIVHYFLHDLCFLWVAINFKVEMLPRVEYFSISLSIKAKAAHHSVQLMGLIKVPGS